MRKTEKRDVEIKVCDFCGEETEHLGRCAVCKREMCGEDGMRAHNYCGTELFRYSDGKRLAGYGARICQECSQKKFTGTIKQFFDGMMSESPVETLD